MQLCVCKNSVGRSTTWAEKNVTPKYDLKRRDTFSSSTSHYSPSPSFVPSGTTEKIKWYIGYRPLSPAKVSLSCVSGVGVSTAHKAAHPEKHGSHPNTHYATVIYKAIFRGIQKKSEARVGERPQDGWAKTCSENHWLGSFWGDNTLKPEGHC